MKQRRIPRTELAEVRRQFARMIDEDVPAKSIMVALKLSRTTYFQWKKNYQERGIDGLKVRPLPGAAPKLTDQQTNQLRGWLVGRDPRQFQFDFALWTRTIVRVLPATSSACSRAPTPSVVRSPRCRRRRPATAGSCTRGASGRRPR